MCEETITMLKYGALDTSTISNSHFAVKRPSFHYQEVTKAATCVTQTMQFLEKKKKKSKNKKSFLYFPKKRIFPAKKILTLAWKTNFLD